MSVLVKNLGAMYKLLARFGMEAVFMTMLIAARSKRQLRELHDAQPENCRLMREDYLKLEAAWEQLYPQGFRAGADEQTLACIFAAMREVEGKHKGRGDLTGYYLERLDKGQEKIMLVTGFGIESIVFPCPQRKGWSDQHFTTTLLGKEFRIAFNLATDGKRMGVRFVRWEFSLTEPLVHALLTKLPKFQISRNSSSSWGGMAVDLCYILDLEGIKEHITFEDGDGEGVTVGGECHIAQPGFIPEVLRRLQAMGIPIEKIEPIMVAERRD